MPCTSPGVGGVPARADGWHCMKHLKVRLSDEEGRLLEACARRRGVSASDTVRDLIRADAAGCDPRSLQAAVLTSLIVGELAVQLILSFLPGGEEVEAYDFDKAAEQAGRHLAQVEGSLQEVLPPWRG